MWSSPMGKDENQCRLARYRLTGNGRRAPCTTSAQNTHDGLLNPSLSRPLSLSQPERHRRRAGREALAGATAAAADATRGPLPKVWVAALPGLSALRGSATRGWKASPEKMACESRPVVQVRLNCLNLYNYKLRIAFLAPFTIGSPHNQQKPQLERRWRVEAQPRVFWWSHLDGLLMTPRALKSSSHRRRGIRDRRA